MVSENVRDWSAFTTHPETGIDRLELAVDGITCAACMGVIERGLKMLEGVLRARVNLTTHRVTIEWVSDRIAAAAIVEKLALLGYRARPFDPAHDAMRDGKEERRLLRALAVAGFAGMNIMLLSVSVWSGNVSDITSETRDLFHWISALIALPAVAYAGRPFFESAFRAISARRLNMDVPISIGVILALAMSVLQTAQGAEHAYFDSAVMLLFFLLIGRYLDQNMRRRTHAFAENLAALRAYVALLVLPDGNLREVPLSKIKSEDLVHIPAGERIAVDGVIEEGCSAIDQSLITGETIAVDVRQGDAVYAGTLNGRGSLRVRVQAAEKGTLFDEVNRLLANAMAAKSRYMRLADRAARLYAPIVHTVAALTFLVWLLIGVGWQKALLIAISTLIITCPCALGLAIPVVQVVASGVLFRHRILLNAGDALERLADIDTVIFDKTGTLTLPDPIVYGGETLLGYEHTYLHALARLSRHPLSVVLTRFSGERRDATFDITVEGVHEIQGEGLEAIIDGKCVRLGQPSFCDAEVEAFVLSQHYEDASLIAFAIEGQKPIVLAVRHSLRLGAEKLVKSLQQRGMDVQILSGDREGPVMQIANMSGIEQWQANMKPADKIDHIEALRAQGHKVLMVGDGLNDAPALAAANISISPITAVDVSKAASDCIFLGEKLDAILFAIDTAGYAHKIMQQNLFFATLYNVIAIPFAVLGYVTPLIAALAMSGSSIVVTCNALRARSRSRY